MSDPKMIHQFGRLLPNYHSCNFSFRLAVLFLTRRSSKFRPIRMHYWPTAMLNFRSQPKTQMQ